MATVVKVQRSGTQKTGEKEAVGKAPVTLPTTVSRPSDQLGDYSVLLFGEKKIGKTSLAAQFEQAFFLMCEPGGKSLSIYQRPVTSWDEFRAYVALLQASRQFRTVVVDTADVAYKLCQQSVCRKMGVTHPSDEEWGKGWEAVRDEFSGQINRLLSSGKGVIFISHAAEREVRTRTGDKYDKIVPTMAGQARDIMEGIVDIWAYYTYRGPRRVLVVQGDDHIGAGHRLTNHFLTKGGERMIEIPMGKSAGEAYRNFLLAFRNQFTTVDGVVRKAP